MATLPAAHLRQALGMPSRIMAVIVAAALLAAACGGGDPAALQDIQGTTRQQLIADRNDPAVMLVLTEYKATISVPTLGYNDAAIQALANQVVAEAQSGQIGSDEKSLDDALVAGIVQNPGAYFTSGQPIIQKDVTLDYQCTGSIVTPDGYIVTAAHCTKIPSDERLEGYIDQGLKPVLQAAVQKFLADNPGFDSDQQQKLSDAVSSYLADQAQLSDESEALAGAMFSSSSSGNRQAVAKPLSVVSQGNPPPSSNGPFGDKDVSIVKLDGYSDLPTLPVGSDASIDTGQQLYVDGYPAAADGTNLQNLGTPTLSAGTVSAMKTSDQGVPLLETTATSSGGNSGGPGFDQGGVMVGIVSYGSSTNGASYNYLIGGSVVQEFLHEKNIRPRQSTTTKLYDTALNDYYRHYYKRALPEFQQVKGLDPSHPYVDSFVQKSQTAIQQGSDQTPLLDSTALLILVVAIVVLLLLPGGGVTFFLVRRRGRKPQRPPGGGAATLAPAMAVQAPFGGAPTPSAPNPAPTQWPQAATPMPPMPQAPGQAFPPQPQAMRVEPQMPAAQHVQPVSPPIMPVPQAGQGSRTPEAGGRTSIETGVPGSPIRFAPPGPSPTPAQTSDPALSPAPTVTPPGWTWDGQRWIPTVTPPGWTWDGQRWIPTSSSPGGMPRR